MFLKKKNFFNFILIKFKIYVYLLLTILLIKFLTLTFLIFLKHYILKAIFKIIFKQLMLSFNNNNLKIFSFFL